MHSAKVEGKKGGKPDKANFRMVGMVPEDPSEMDPNTLDIWKWSWALLGPSLRAPNTQMDSCLE